MPIQQPIHQLQRTIQLIQMRQKQKKNDLIELGLKFNAEKEIG
jgi:hypothetical protein